MKNKALILLELRKLWGINELCCGKDRRGYRITTVAAPLILSAILAFYLGAVSYGLLQLGMDAGQMQTLILFAVFSILLMIGFFRTGAQLFSDSNAAILLAMPVLPREILAARWLRLYLEDLPMAVLPVIASLIVLGTTVQMQACFFVLPLISALFLPLMPIALSGLLSIFTERLVARKRHRVVLSAMLTAAELLIIGSALKLWTIVVMKGSDHLILWGISLILTSVMTAAAAKSYIPILTNRKPFPVHGKLELNSLRKGTLHRTLVRREWQQYLSHGTYVTNTAVGPIMAVAVSAGLLFADLPKLGIPEELAPMVPFLPAIILAMMNPTVCSISIEGKNWWIFKAMPLRTREIVLAKLHVGMSLPLLSVALSATLLVIRSHESAVQILTCLMVPLSAGFFSAVWGLSANLRFPNFHWEDEVEIVKQGAASLIGGLVPCLLVLACGGLSTLLPDWGGIAVASMVLLASVILLRLLFRQKLPD